MPSRRTALGTLLLLACARPARATGRFRPLYNGRDLHGWHVESGRLEAWRADGELLSCTGKGGGYLATDAEYADFELRLHYLLGPGGNSGVGIRFPRGGWPSTDGIELQLLDDMHPRHAGLQEVHWNGSLYSFLPPLARPARPAGQWNHLELRCEGPRLCAAINGVVVQNVNLDLHRGTGKGALPLACRPRRGLLGLQSHGDPVSFRRVELRVL
jgi:hypothetical protein